MNYDEFYNFILKLRAKAVTMNRIYASFEEFFYNEDDNGDCIVTYAEYSANNEFPASFTAFKNLAPDKAIPAEITLKERVNPYYYEPNRNFSRYWPSWAKSIP